jgi:hypothetical protein
MEPVRWSRRPAAVHRRSRRRSPLLWAALVVPIILSGCNSTATPSPSQSPGPLRTTSQLKIDLIHGLGMLWYCDPDFYPLARGDEIDQARKRWAEVRADAEAFNAIVADLGIAPDAAFTDAQKLAVYHRWKVLRAIALTPVGDTAFQFDYLAEPAAGASDGTRSAGTISTSGQIAIEQQAPAGAPNCPICLARGTPIDVPGGAIAIEDVRIGDAIWTVDAAGIRVVGEVLAIGSTTAPVDHHVVHLVLADGRTVTASPGHPLADGRHLGDLRPGDAVDGSVVAEASLLPYSGGETFDLVVAGDTGTYFSDGIPLGSTLRAR